MTRTWSSNGTDSVEQSYVSCKVIEMPVVCTSHRTTPALVYNCAILCSHNSTLRHSTRDWRRLRASQLTGACIGEYLNLTRLCGPFCLTCRPANLMRCQRDERTSAIMQDNPAFNDCHCRTLPSLPPFSKWRLNRAIVFQQLFIRPLFWFRWKTRITGRREIKRNIELFYKKG